MRTYEFLQEKKNKKKFEYGTKECKRCGNNLPS